MTNKEQHAEEIQHIISQYFLTQRIKQNERKEPESIKRYMNQLSLCYKILVLLMKTKQRLVLKRHTYSFGSSFTHCFSINKMDFLRR
ncbi:MAG TPA: hypothetical protein ENL46_06775 [Candidatus Aminicenantes bacterium]|nr:hypothetical protein [Candidatus Aminicenantes bacterium]